MNFMLSVACSMSIVVAAIIGAWRFKSINKDFRPFLFCLWLGLFNEILSLVAAKTIHNTAINGNIYVLCESLLLLWQFRRWGLFGRQRPVFYLIGGFLLAEWVIENFIIFSIVQFSSWFRIIYSFIIVLLSVSMLNRQILVEKGPLLKNPVALLCLAFIIYYTYKVLVETFWVYGLNESSTFQTKVYLILDYFNLFSNLIYALAVLWMPTKHRFTMPSSSPAPF